MNNYRTEEDWINAILYRAQLLLIGSKGNDEDKLDEVDTVLCKAESKEQKLKALHYLLWEAVEGRLTLNNKKGYTCFW